MLARHLLQVCCPLTTFCRLSDSATKTHYTTNGTAFLSTTTPFHSCATDLAFSCFSLRFTYPQISNVDTVRSTEVGSGAHVSFLTAYGHASHLARLGRRAQLPRAKRSKSARFKNAKEAKVLALRNRLGLLHFYFG